jgi:hypothetical protein
VSEKYKSLKLKGEVDQDTKNYYWDLKMALKHYNRVWTLGNYIIVKF